MKKRYGFVSNSSSSSFIIASKPGEKIKMEIEIDPSKYMRSYTNGGEPITTIENLNSYYSYEFDWIEDDFHEALKTKTIDEILLDNGESYLAERYLASKEAIESGLSIYDMTFSSECYDDPIESFMYGMTVEELKDIVNQNETKIIDGDCC